jgi:lipopolysaccharide export system protein LptC
MRLRSALLSYLPLLLMAALALASWWLVKNTPQAQPPAAARTPSHEPDYTMTDFAVERFGAAGDLKLRISGARLRHFPDTDHIEVEDALIRAYAPDGRVTLARARRALGTGDGRELQLLGGAEVTGHDAAGAPVLMQGEFLHAFLVSERVRSHLPVRVRSGNSELHAAGLDYDHPARRLELTGPVRATLTQRAATPGAR